MAALQHAAAPENDYLLISQAGVTELLARLDGEDAQLAHFRFRDACGYEASPKARRRASVPHAHDVRARDGWGLGCGPGARPERGDAAGRRARDRPLRRGTRDLHRARVRDAGRALAHAAHGRRPVRPRGVSGVRTARRRRRGAGEPESAGRLRRVARAAPRGLLDAARASRSRNAGVGLGAGGRADRAAGRAGGQRWLGAAPAPAALHRPRERPARGGVERRGGRVAQRLPGPEPAARPARRCGRAGAAAGHRRAPAGGDEPGALARLLGSAPHRSRRGRVSLRRGRSRVPGPRQQRRARRALPSARRRRGRGGRWRS